MNNAAQNPGTPRFMLKVGTRSIPLDLGVVITGDQLGVHRPKPSILRVDPLPKDPAQLILVNLSDVTWSVRAADGEVRDISPQKAVRVEEGRRIDFGGVTGVIMAGGVAIASLVSIDKEAMEKLARRLYRAASEGVVDQKEFDRLHAAFFAVDEQGVAWTVGLQKRDWNRAESGKWVCGGGPNELVIEVKVLDQLAALEQRLAKAK